MRFKYVLTLHFSRSLEMGTVSRSGYRVSAKIQQLLNTLKKPKRRHLEEFYEDDDVELEMAANPKDPNAPTPEGNTMMPAVGPQLVRLTSFLLSVKIFRPLSC